MPLVSQIHTLAHLGIETDTPHSNRAELDIPQQSEMYPKNRKDPSSKD